VVDGEQLADLVGVAVRGGAAIDGVRLAGERDLSEVAHARHR